MAIGRLTQAVTLAALPPGFSFTVTRLVTEDYGHWSSYFMPARKIPFTSAAGDEIISSVLHTSSVLDSGAGPSSQLDFAVSGEIGGQQYHKSGMIRFASTNWNRLSRPDFSILLYQLEGSAAQVVSRPTSNFLNPDPFALGFSVVGKDLVMTVNLTSEKTTEVLNYLLTGVFLLHKQLANWVWGQLKAM